MEDMLHLQNSHKTTHNSALSTSTVNCGPIINGYLGDQIHVSHLTSNSISVKWVLSNAGKDSAAAAAAAIAASTTTPYSLYLSPVSTLDLAGHLSL